MEIKDPNKPKKPLSAYHIWFSEERENIEENVKQTNPEFCYYELVQSASKMWRDDVDTDVYNMLNVPFIVSHFGRHVIHSFLTPTMCKC